MRQKRGRNVSFKLAFSRITQTWVTKPIKEKDKSYLQYIVDEVFYLRSSGETYSVASLPKSPKNIGPVDKVKPLKNEAIAAHRSRFSKE